MVATPTFRYLEIQDFRGFRSPQRLELDASAVIVVGPNGTGKTSLFDAMQWLVMGALPRFDELVTRRSDDHIVNRWSESSSAVVSAELQIGDRRVFVRRSGTAAKSRLELREAEGPKSGDEAQRRLASLLIARPGVSLQEAMTTSGLLQQDALRVMIQSEPRQRYGHLARLLGLEDLPTYEATSRSNADSLSKKAKERRSSLDKVERELRDATQELQHATLELRQAPSVQRLVQDITERLSMEASALAIDGGFPWDTDSLSRLGTDARRVRERVADLISEARRLGGLPEALPSASQEALRIASEQSGRLANELEEAETAVLSAQESLQKAERVAMHLSELAARALPLLEEFCPICGQPIDSEHVGSRLKSILTQEPTDLATVRSVVEQAVSRRDTLARDSRRAAKWLDELGTALAESKRRQDDQRAWANACSSLAAGIGMLRPVDAQAVKEGKMAALEAVGRAAGEIERSSREAAAGIAAPLLGGKVEQHRARVERLEAEAEQLREEVVIASRRAEEARALAHATAEAVTRLTSRRFEALEPIVTEIYSRLDPHPAFTRLYYSLGVEYKRPVADPLVSDEEFAVTADPLLIFSSSQANVAALTFFLAMSWTAGSQALPFLLMDDPLQAMDDINALGFADLCRHIRGARQLVISTQDRRLGGLLERKLAPRAAGERTRVLRFVGWDRSGPQIEQEEIVSQLETAERRVLMEAA